MRKAALLIAFSGLLAGPALGLAQSGSAAASPQFAPPPPPPGMNDPGVHARRPASKAAAARSADMSEITVPRPERGEMSPASLTPTRMGSAPVIRDPAHPDGAPADDQADVKTSKQGENTVEEFRRGGQVYMVKITPRYGPPQTYYVHPRDATTNNAGSNVRPPMYTLFEWGKPQKPVDPDHPDGDDDGD